MGSVGRSRPVYPATAARAARLRLALGLMLTAAALPAFAEEPVKPSAPTASHMPESLADLAEAVSDAVVNISASQTVEDKRGGGNGAPQFEPGTPFDDLFEEFFRRRQQRGGGGERGAKPRERRSNSLGSGFVIDPAGIIITNNHVIADANEVTVIFTDGQKLKAQVIGKDTKVDVAVLKVKPEKPLKAVKFGNSDKMRVGDPVLAVGNPFGLGGTVTAGIISARNRNIDSGPYDNYIQTDAAINRGNSGGPLFNMAGEVIGINTAILSPSGGSIGIGFATPSATVMPVVEQLEKFGETRRGWLGVHIQNVDETIAESLNLGNARGALIAGVDSKGPAKVAGLQTGDVIVKFDNTPIKESRDLPKLVAMAPVGKDVPIVLFRQGKEITKTVKLGRLEENEKQAALESSHNESTQDTLNQRVLGMSLSNLNDDTRQKFSIRDTVGSGVVITDIDPESAAAEKHVQAGDVIVEINQDQMKSPTDVSKKLKSLKEQGKKTALLLIANNQGEVRFIAVGMQ
ncbi:Do family serine endopeptidase [Beijerinckia mobilis]|uniref:Do family serine endopeptidase n=1 Tax=Beijerinckia mobilis TaxID=231434 RepID=UPI00054F8404|nr:Do family serine endopeptidase [Beijerinckia mobilis]